MGGFTIDSLKIECSFVVNLPHDANEAEIVRVVVLLGHVLGLKMIAEGIETREQYELLRAAGCDEVQGLHFSWLLPAPHFARPLMGVPVATLMH